MIKLQKAKSGFMRRQIGGQDLKAMGLYRCDRKYKIGGGVTIQVKYIIVSRERDDINVVYPVWIEIVCCKNSWPLPQEQGWQCEACTHLIPSW